MTDLIRSQLEIIATMACCGFACGLVAALFQAFAAMIATAGRARSILAAAVKLSGCLAIAVLIGEFSYSCQNGNLSFTGFAALAGGLWLWKALGCDIIKKNKRE